MEDVKAKFQHPSVETGDDSASDGGVQGKDEIIAPTFINLAQRARERELFRQWDHCLKIEAPRSTFRPKLSMDPPRAHRKLLRQSERRLKGAVPTSASRPKLSMDLDLDRAHPNLLVQSERGKDEVPPSSQPIPTPTSINLTQRARERARERRIWQHLERRADPNSKNVDRRTAFGEPPIEEFNRYSLPTEMI